MANLLKLEGGQLLAFCTKLAKGGITKEMAEAILSDRFPGGSENLELVETAAQAIQRRLEKRNKPPAFPTWRTITIGDQTSVKALVKAIEAKGLKIGDWARDILNKVMLAKKPEELELVVVSVADLGFKNGASRKDIYDRAISLGLSLCPAEVGPQLRLQYADQPNGEWLRIAMEPIAHSDGDISVFGVDRRDDDRWLRTSIGHPDDVWHPDDCWVFLRGKQ